MLCVKAFYFDAEIGWKTFIEENGGRSFSEQLNAMHAELLLMGMLVRGKETKQYDKAVKMVQYEEGDGLLLFYPPGKLEMGRTLESPWLGPYKVVQRLSPTCYALKGEVSGVTARMHVNRLRRFLVETNETGAPQAGVYPDSRRIALRITGSEFRDGERWIRPTSVR